MILIFAILFSAMICFFAIIFSYALTRIYLKRAQREWDELKVTLKAFAPSITQDELREAYVNFIETVGYYYPRF